MRGGVATSRLRLVGVALAGAAIVVVNVVQLPAIEQSRDARYRATSFVPNNDFVPFAVENDVTVKAWYGLPVALSTLEMTGSLSLPADADITVDRLRASILAFSGIQNVTLSDISPAASAEDVLTARGADLRATGDVQHGTAVGGIERWEIIVDSGPVTDLIGIVVEGTPRTLIVIDSRLVAEGVIVR